MTVDLETLTKLSQDELLAEAQRNPEWFAELLENFQAGVEADRKETQLAYYTLANPMASRVHTSTAREIAIVGGNRSTKTDTMLAELAIQMTNHVPKSLEAVYPREKLKGPIRARVVCNSLTDTLEPIIKPKLRWDQWNGVGDPREGNGHWGWLPRHLLRGGQWESAYSDKYRTLYAAVDSFWIGSDGAVNSSRGYSSCQFMSYDQDLSAFAGSSMHFVGHDELPPWDIYRENRMRTLDVKGRIYTAFTPPDEVGTSRVDVTSFFDEVYEKGLPGPYKDPMIETIILHTEKNRILSADDVAMLSARLTDAQREVRLRGEFIHLSGVIYPMFTTYESYWCFKCHKKTSPIKGECVFCSSAFVGAYSHVVEPFEVPKTWPVVFVIDPHPRKKDAIAWFAVSPSDDTYLIAEMEVDGTAKDVARAVREFEDASGIHPVKRLMDPNIATETNDKLMRGWTIRRAYDEEGLRCDLANDDMNTGITAVIDLLTPDPRTHRPRFAAFSTCTRFIRSMTRWSWDEWTRQGDRDPKERPRDTHKDFCDLVRYFAMDRPNYGAYRTASAIFRRAR